MIGAGIGGFFISRINPWILVALSLSCFGIIEFIIPLCTNLVSLGLALAASSVFGNLYDASKYIHICIICSWHHVTLFALFSRY